MREEIRWLARGRVGYGRARYMSRNRRFPAGMEPSWAGAAGLTY
jgi:hypothetical protein